MKTSFCSLVAVLAMISPASAVIATGNPKSTGNVGYVVEAVVSFDSHRPFLHEFYGEDDDKNSGLINFSYSVVDPAGTLSRFRAMESAGNCNR